MCRLFGYVARTPEIIAQPLEEIFDALIKVSHIHGDGWGLAWYDEKDNLHLSRASEAAYASSEFSPLIHSVCTNTCISHVRWATPGFPLCDVNTHPFTNGKFAFAHNGAISPNETLETLIAPHFRTMIKGTTDSERYFLALLSALEQVPPVDAFRTLLQSIHQQLRSSSLNCLFLTPDALYVLNDYDPNAPLAQKEPDYFHLHYRVTPDVVMIGSTGLGQHEGWSKLDNGQLLIVERGSLHVSVIDISRGMRKPLRDEYTSSLQR
ncbi:MAG: class II glutamine amidotransferase [Ktedonobacteraceae bacterium]